MTNTENSEYQEPTDAGIAAREAVRQAWANVNQDARTD